MSKAVYVGVGDPASRDLPGGYTQVQYIESSGTQYIDTGFRPSQDARVVMDAQITAASLSTHAVIFGCRTTATTGMFALGYAGHKSPQSFRSDYGSDQKSFEASVALNKRHMFDKSKSACAIDSNSVTNAASAFQVECNLFLFANNDAGTLNNATPMRLYSCRIYDGDSLVRDFVPCKNPGGTVGLYDMANATFYAGSGSGTFKAGGTVLSGAVARRVSKMYVGVGGKARRIKYGYVGVDGKARQFYSAGELSKPAFNATPTFGNGFYGAASIGDYALFAGGFNNNLHRPADGSTTENRIKSKVMSINSSLTVGAPSELSVARYGMATASTSTHACFLYGGRAQYDGLFYYTYSYNSNACDIYNASLTRQTMEPPVKKSESQGYNGNEEAQGVSDKIYVRIGSSVYMADKSLTWRKLEDMRDRTSNNRYDHVQFYPRIGAVGEQMILAGGLYYEFNSSGDNYYSPSNLVDAYDASGTRRNAGNLPYGGHHLSVAASADRMLLFGYLSTMPVGWTESQYVQVINKSLTATNRGKILPDDIEYMATASVDGITIAMGGEIDHRYGPSYNGFNETARAYMFDEAITCSRAPDASVGRESHKAACAGANMIFGSGYNSKSSSDGMTSNYAVHAMDVYCYK
jgi:hypothetical protein